MALFKVLKTVLCFSQKPPSESVNYLQFLRPSSSGRVTALEAKTTPEKKLLRVALVGRPNAGKSTLINKIMNLNICGVSQKSHTTLNLLRASFINNETQIVFLDTPGLVTAKEFSRFNLSENFLKNSPLNKKVNNEVDIIGVIHPVKEPADFFKFPFSLTQPINNLLESKTLFFVFNKVDLILESALMDVVKSYKSPMEVAKRPKFLQKFSKIFFTSAIQNKGVQEIVDYLLQQAKPSPWLFEPDEVHNTPLETLILEHLRAQFLENFPQEIPYCCNYEIEYLKENDFGEITCVSLITCRYAKHVTVITSNKRKNLRLLCKEMESNLFRILGKVFRIRVVVQAPPTD